MSIYSDASQLKEMLQEIVNDMIAKNPIVKSAIKAKKATVVSVDTAKQTVNVQFPLDSTVVTLPYNPQMETYLTTGTVKGKTVSVWYNQSINNGIVMQNGEWSV